MAGGMSKSQSLFFKIKVLTKGLKNTKRLQGRLQGLSRAGRRAQRGIGRVGRGARKLGRKTRSARGVQRLRGALNGMGRAGQQAKQGLNKVSTGAENAGSAGEDSSRTFGKMFGVGMNLMFLGMALQKMFAGLAGSILKMVGVSKVFGAAVKVTLLPFFIRIAPLLNKIAFAFMNLSKPIKMVLGAFVGLMAVMATFLFFGAQIGIMAATISGSFMALAASLFVVLGAIILISVGIAGIVMLFKTANKAMAALMLTISALGLALLALGSYLLMADGFLGPLKGAIVAVKNSVYGAAAAMQTLNISITTTLLSIGAIILGLLFLRRIFKKFGPVITFIASLIMGALLAPFLAVAAAVMVAYGAFLFLNKIFKKFGKIVGYVVGAVMLVVGGLLALFLSLPIGIGLVIGALIALFWNFKDEIISALKGIWNWLKNIPNWFNNQLGRAGSFIKKWVNKIINFFLNLPGKIQDAMVNLGKSMVDGVIQGLKSIGGQIADTFWNLLPAPLANALKNVSGFTGKILGGIGNVLTPNDFILTSGGKMIQPAANDTIIGTKNPGQLGASGSGDVTVNINDPVMKDEVDVQRLVDEVEDRVNRDTRGRTGGLGT